MYLAAVFSIFINRVTETRTYIETPVRGQSYSKVIYELIIIEPNESLVFYKAKIIGSIYWNYKILNLNVVKQLSFFGLLGSDMSRRAGF